MTLMKSSSGHLAHIKSRLYLSVACVAATALAITFVTSVAKAHVLRFTGVSIQQGRILQSKFPSAFDREITLSEVDDILRFLMKTGAYSSLNVVARETAEGPELLLVATPLRKIKAIEIVGNRAFSNSEVKQALQIDEGKTLERKELIEAIKNLQTEYRKRGYRSMNAEVDFQTPSETEVGIKVSIDEGTPTQVDKIQIDTVNPEVQEIAEKIVKTLKGKSLNEETLQLVIKNLSESLREKRYLLARISEPQPVFDEKQEHVRINLTIENPWQYRFEFVGNTAVSEFSLIKNMALDQLTGTVTTPTPELAERLRRFYQEQGYAHIVIKTTEKQLDRQFRRDIRFEIEEGPRVRIKKIDISGNIARDGDYYAQFIRSSSSDLIGEGYYNRKDIEEGIKNLEEELQNQGYLRAKVKSWRSEFVSPQKGSKLGSQATLYLNIDEGPLTVIRQIRFEGVEAFSKLQLLNALPLHTGESLKIKDLNEAIEALKGFYASQGYVEMRILNEKEGMVTYNDNSTQATIEFQVFEGPKVTISSIVIEGNEQTKDIVIMRELGFKPGDTYTPALRDDAIFHLQKLELFSKVNIRTLEEGTSMSDRTVIVQLEEGPAGYSETGIGVYSDNVAVIRGYTGIGYKNLWGTARATSFRVDPSYSTNPRISYLEHKVALSYLEPYIFGDRNRGRMNLTRDVKFTDFDTVTQNAIIQEENAVTLQLERDFSRYIRLTFTGYSFSNQTLFDRVTRDIKRTQNVAKVGPFLEFDYRDNAFYPTKGSYTSIGAEYSDPLIGSSDDRSQKINFAKFVGSFAYPYRIGGSSRWIFANMVRSGYVVNMGDRANSIPAQEAFFLGSRTTIRGFNGVDRDQVPNRYQLGVNDLRDFYVSSDSYFYLIKSELRFPIYRGLSLGDVSGAIFYDGGAVILSQLPIENPYRDSIGLALRLGVTGGIYVSFEYGLKLERKKWQGAHEEPGAFYFAIGTF